MWAVKLCSVGVFWFCITFMKSAHGATCIMTVEWLWSCVLKAKASPYLITERRIAELILVLGSQPAGDMSHKPNGRLPLLSTRPAVTPATLKRADTSLAAW